MKSKISYILFALSVLLTSSMFSCSSDDLFEGIEDVENKEQSKTCELILNVEKLCYDGNRTTRSTTSSVSDWKNGDKIYLTFLNGSEASYGDAIYNDGSWMVSYYGTLVEGVPTKCHAVFFDNPKFERNSVVQTDENTGIYEDMNGQYVYNEGILSVTATLSPKTGRIRFAGKESESITVYGITHYTSFDCSKGKYTTSIAALNSTVASGYTPYLYGEFSDSEQPRLNIITESSGYTRLMPNTVFRKGESGYMDIPTISSHKGWRESVILKVNGVEFTMIFVEYPYGSFLLAETETTERLYDAITTGNINMSKLPKMALSYNQWQTFIYNLKKVTELNFYIPTREEWQYAFKGGNISGNYVYSGSDVIFNVAWYAENSDGKPHEVKQLQPNELGFYDMSGNAFEFTSYYDGDEYYFYGGYYDSLESDCIFDFYEKAQGHEGVGYAGLRIALKP